jgi:2-oxoisovalerate dehydrogenase E1 component
MPESTSELLDAYRQMLLIRLFEEKCLELSAEGFYPGSVHTSTGQEAIPVGVRAALRPDDRVLPTYRGHGWALMAGVPVVELLAEITQRAAGLNGGRGGSAYLTSPEHGLFGENSIVGAGVPIGAGVALAAVRQGTGRIAVVSIGDGAMNQGSVHEGMIFAAAYSLPVVYVVENNAWSEMTETASLLKNPNFTDRAAALGIAVRVVDGGDPLAVAAAMAEAATHARAGRGPTMLDCTTVRLRGHYNRDIEHYRPKADVASAQATEPLVRIRARLREAGVAESETDAIDAEVEAIIRDAAAAVLGMPEPNPADAFAHVYGPTSPVTGPQAQGTPTTLTYQRAVNKALDLELETRPEVLVYGEDVGFPGGIFGVSRGLQKTHGVERVFDTPISESAILGSAVGAAMEGLRPVVEIMWMDFLLVALDQLVNQAANVRYVTQSALHAPLVVRTQQGATAGSCAQHDQSLEALIAHVPGLRVGLPATPGDAYAMTRAAIADDDPVVLIEARALYQVEGDVHLDAEPETIGGARFHRRGGDIAIITWGAMLHRVLDAADALEAEGISATVLDLRWLNPLDELSIAEAVRSSAGRILVVHEANRTGGFGAEIVARIQDEHFSLLSGPVRRLATPDSRLPAAGPLQAALVPTTEAITDAARMLVSSMTA